jgi:site-specific DNA-methyltransferase (adenine-specific)
MKVEEPKVLNIDCMEFMQQYPDKFFDLAVVDPPYGIERFAKPSGTTRFKSSKLMQEEGLTWDIKPTDEYWNELFRVSKNQIVFGANNFTMPPSEYFLIWDKAQTVDNFATAEYAWVSMGLKKPAKIYRYSIHKHNHTDKIHPTQKPVKLYDWIFHNYAKPNDKILDTHLGSGSSRIAADKNKLQFWACELDKEYFEAQEKRFNNYKSQLTLF